MYCARQHRHFSLAEVLLAFALLALGFAGAAGVMHASQKLELRSHSLLAATRLARFKMETVFLNAQLNAVESSATTGAEQVEGREFRWTVVTEPFDDEFVGQLVRARVTVQWREKAQERTYVTAAVLRSSRPGVNK